MLKLMEQSILNINQFKDDWWGFNIPVEFQKDFLGYENYILAFNRGSWSSESELV